MGHNPVAIFLLDSGVKLFILIQFLLGLMHEMYTDPKSEANLDCQSVSESRPRHDYVYRTSFLSQRLVEGSVQTRGLEAAMCCSDLSHRVSRSSVTLRTRRHVTDLRGINRLAGRLGTSNCESLFSSVFRLPLLLACSCRVVTGTVFPVFGKF